MIRRLIVELVGRRDLEHVEEMANSVMSACPTCHGLADAVIAAAHRAELPEACPTCQGQGCERCYNSGRRHLTKIAIAPTSTGRATIDVWQGSPGTMQLVATTPKDKDVADVTIDALLACLRDGGLVIDDRRAR